MKLVVGASALALAAMPCTAPPAAAAARTAAPAPAAASSLRMVTIDTTAGGSLLINDAGRVAGVHMVPGTGRAHAFTWTASGGVVDLGDLTGDGSGYSWASALSRTGVIAGDAQGKDGLPHPIVWTARSGMRDLGGLSSRGGGGAYSVNSCGHAAGVYFTRTGASRAFIWSAKRGMRDLGTLGGAEAEATQINDHDVVVGRAQTANGGWHAFVWTPATGMRDLSRGAPAMRQFASWAMYVNDQGTVAGWTYVNSTTLHTFRWTARTGMVVLGSTTGNVSSGPSGIDRRGRITGTSSDNGAHALVWTTRGVTRDLLGGAPGVSRAMSGNGRVAGAVYLTGGRTLAFRWSTWSGAQTLTCPSQANCDGAGVNDRGQVVGYVRGFDGSSHVVLWTR